MAGKGRYDKSPKVGEKKQEAGGKQETEKPVKPAAEKVDKSTKEEKPEKPDGGTSKAVDPKPDEEAGDGKVPVHVAMRHAQERAALHTRHMMEHQEIHGRHEREHAEAVGAASGSDMIDQVRGGK